MANIVLQDSGFLSPTNTGTRATSANMCNSGNAISLKTATFTPHIKSNVDNTPRLGIFSDGTSVSDGSNLNLASIENMDFTITGILNMTVAADQALVVPLAQIGRTKYYKLLYYDSNGSDKDKQLLYQLCDDTFTAGEVTVFGLSAAFNHLHVLIEDVSFVDTGTSHVRYTLKGRVTSQEDSSI